MLLFPLDKQITVLHQSLKLSLPLKEFFPTIIKFSGKFIHILLFAEALLHACWDKMGYFSVPDVSTKHAITYI